MKKIIFFIIIFFISGLLAGLFLINYKWLKVDHDYPDIIIEEEIESNNIMADKKILKEGLNPIDAFVVSSDGQIFGAEKSGKIFTITKDGQFNEIFINWRNEVAEFGQSGLLGLTIHYDFPQQSFVYLFYTYEKEGEIFNRLSRLIYNNFQLSNEEIIIDRLPAGTIRNGGNLVFSPDNKLLVTLGDTGDPSLTQERSQLAGKILRYNPDGSQPEDNPRLGDPIFAIGLRNPGGIFFDGQNKGFFIEEGQSGQGINVLQPGGNYSWPMASICRNNYPDYVLSSSCDIKIESFAFCFSCFPGLENILLFSGSDNILKVASIFNVGNTKTLVVKDHYLVEDHKQLNILHIDNNNIYLQARDEKGDYSLIKMSLRYKN